MLQYYSIIYPSYIQQKINIQQVCLPRSINTQNLFKIKLAFLNQRSPIRKLKKRRVFSSSFIQQYFICQEGKQAMKKVRPLEIINNSSISNISTNEVLQHSWLSQCRFCKKSLEGADQQVLPCACREPIHKSCLAGEMEQRGKKVRRVRTADKEKRYNCSKCAEVIRFSSLEQLACRSCREVAVFSKENACMCAALTVAALLACGLMAFLVLLKSTAFQMGSEAVLQSAVIGCSIAIAVILLIVLYFFVSDVLLKVTERVELLGEGRERKGRITIQDCS